MSASLTLAVALAALAGLLALPPPGRLARSRVRGSGESESNLDGRCSRGDPARRSRLLARATSVTAGAAVWQLVGGAPGAVLGLLTILVVPALIGRLEPAQRRRERLELQRNAPVVADLLAAALAAGVPMEQSLAVIARSMGGATGGLLQEVSRRVELGEALESAWAQVGRRPGLEGIARALARAGRTGAPLADLLSAEAADLRARAAAAALAEARAASVRAVLPLGLCLLPAFGLLGILPVVAGLLAGL